MKKFVLILAALVNYAFAQSYITSNVNRVQLKENKVDEFEKKLVRRTDCDALSNSMKINIRSYVIRVDTTIILHLKFMRNGVFGVPSGEAVMIKLLNDTVVKLNNKNYEVSCAGCGTCGLGGAAAPGVDLAFILSKTQVHNLRLSPVVKIRFYSDKGYTDEDITQDEKLSIAEQIYAVLK